MSLADEPSGPSPVRGCGFESLEEEQTHSNGPDTEPSTSESHKESPSESSSSSVVKQGLRLFFSNAELCTTVFTQITVSDTSSHDPAEASDSRV